MSDNGAAAAAGASSWSLPDSGLQRSYSEHADLVLRHFRQHRRRPAVELAKCTRSGPDFRASGEADDEEEEEEDDEEDEDEENDGEEDEEAGSRTWRISSSSIYEESRPYRLQSSGAGGDMGAGDSGALSSDFSRLSLRSSKQLQPHNHSRLESKGIEDEEAPFEFVMDEEDEENYSQAERLEFEEDECREMSEPNFGRRLNGQILKRKISYEDWAREKKMELQRRREEAQRIERERREAEEREREEREVRERKEEECYVEWLKRKEREKLLRRKLLDKELELQRKIQDVEQKAKSAKDVCLKQWFRKKEEQLKASEKEEIEKKKKAEEEKQRRLQESMKAYERWREKSINTPRPATQGLLPHQKAKPAFTNPTPWQPLVDNPSDESDDGNRPKTTNVPTKTKKYGIRR